MSKKYDIISTTKVTAIIILAQVLLFPVQAQVKKAGTELKREVTLYNPYKPSLIDVRKKSFLPEIIDTARITPSFSYQVTSKPYSPTFTISPIKPASLLSDPLSRLYKGYVKIGAGNYTTPLAEITIANTRSNKGAIGLFVRHYSSNGKIVLPDSPERVPAPFMDNNASLFGKKFFDKSVLGISVDYLDKARYAYGYNSGDPQYIYVPIKKDIKSGFFDIGATASFSSLNLDSADFSYDFGVTYDYFRYSKYMTTNHIGVKGSMAKLYKGFYIGSGVSFNHYSLSDSIDMKPKFIFSATPFVRKSSEQWEFNLGLELALEKNLTIATRAHLFPDLNFGFSIFPGYLRFFAALSGKLENNDPMKVFEMNPYLKTDGSIFKVPNTSYPLIVTGGLKGNDGIGGNYITSVSYSVVNDILLFANINHPDTLGIIERGNHFVVVPDDAEILNIHGELTGDLSSKLSFRAGANFYKYTLSANSFAWNKPDWDGNLSFTYNLRNKIIAGAEFTALGKRNLLVLQSSTGWATLEPVVKEMPAHVNIGLSAEYRYTKILSLWVKVNNISYDRYYEWAFYPSQRFNFMVGFSYSL
jgi:hypothetical protein